MNEELNQMINNDRRLHMVPSSVHEILFLRFVICSTKTTHDDVLNAYKIIYDFAIIIIEKYKNR